MTKDATKKSAATGSTGSGSKDGSNSDLHSSITPEEERVDKGVVYGRILFSVGLLVLIAALAVSLCFYETKRTANDAARANDQYEVVMNRALVSTERLLANRLEGANAMASLAAYAFPTAKEWPFVWVDSWWAVGSSVQVAGLKGGYSLAPIVAPDDQSQFEAFARDHLDGAYPDENAGASSFGFGIWCKNKTTPSADTRYHHTNGHPYSYDSENAFATPKFQHTKGNHRLLMMDVHGFPQQGKSIDDAYQCGQNRKERKALSLSNTINLDAPDNATAVDIVDDNNDDDDDDDDNYESCQALSDLTPPKDPLARTGPGAFVATCVFPAQNKTECVAMIFAKMNIYEVLDNTFPELVRGIDCVVETKPFRTTASYRMENGLAMYRGNTDTHDKTYQHMAKSIRLFEGTKVADTSISYDMTCYPTEEYYGAYRTETPVAAIAGAVLVVAGLCACFFLYDFWVRREFRSKKELLRAKRQFVRFVSHEVRTPLNSVCMALTLLQEEIAQALGCATVEEMEKMNSHGNVNGNGNGNGNDKAHLLREGAANASTTTDTDTVSKTQEIVGWFNLAKEVQVNAESSVEVLNDLLNYDKVESGSLSLELTAIPIWETIRHAVSEFRLPADSKDIKLTLNLPPSLSSSSSSSLPKTIVTTASTERNESAPTPTLRDRKVVGDSIRLVQVVRNLVSNAIKFTPAGKAVNINVHWRPAAAAATTTPTTTTTTTTQSTRIKESIRTKESSQAARRTVGEQQQHHHGSTRTFKLKTNEVVSVPQCGEIVLCVEDEGAGLSAEELSKLFGAGVQFNVNELQAGNGSGLGLFIAKGIIEQHEGTLVCHSAGRGCGTSFTVTLPLYGIPDPVPEHPEVDEEFQNTYRQNSLRVLVVDDARSNRKLLTRLLTKRDNHCDEAENGREAVDMVREAADRGEAPYDLILLDYEMPVMNGPTAATEIRDVFSRSAPFDANSNDRHRHHQHQHSFIVGVTGNFMDEDIQYFKRCGADAVLPKPFKVQDLENLCVEYHVTGSIANDTDEE